MLFLRDLDDQNCKYARSALVCIIKAKSTSPWSLKHISWRLNFSTNAVWLNSGAFLYTNLKLYFTKLSDIYPQVYEESTSQR